jgi:hypothetical protein
LMLGLNRDSIATEENIVMSNKSPTVLWFLRNDKAVSP